MTQEAMHSDREPQSSRADQLRLPKADFISVKIKLDRFEKEHPTVVDRFRDMDINSFNYKIVDPLDKGVGSLAPGKYTERRYSFLLDDTPIVVADRRYGPNYRKHHGTPKTHERESLRAVYLDKDRAVFQGCPEHKIEDIPPQFILDYALLRLQADALEKLEEFVAKGPKDPQNEGFYIGKHTKYYASLEKYPEIEGQASNKWYRVKIAFGLPRLYEKALRLEFDAELDPGSQAPAPAWEK